MEISAYFYTAVIMVVSSVGGVIFWTTPGFLDPGVKISAIESPPIESPPVKEAFHDPGEDFGYILVLKDKEQLTCGAANLLSQLCLTQKISNNVRLVEPFLVTSYFGFPTGTGYSSTQHPALSFFDIFDRSDWESITAKTGVNPFTDWEHFLKYAPREVILVVDQWSAPTHRHELPELLTRNNFYLKKTVAKNFSKTGVLTLERFVDMIYGNTPPEEVTVVFDQFGGITRTDIAAYLESVDIDCEKRILQNYIFTLLKPSKRLSDDAQRYKQEFLDQQYISIMIRSEHISKDIKEPAKKREQIEKCLTKAKWHLDSIQKLHSLPSVFVAMDIGRHGSDGYINGHRKDQVKHFSHELENFIPAVTNGALSFDEWESSFDDIAGSVDSGYISVLQKEIAIEGKCLILVGGGQYQSHAYNLFMSLNKESAPCIIRLNAQCNVH